MYSCLIVLIHTLMTKGYHILVAKKVNSSLMYLPEVPDGPPVEGGVKVDDVKSPDVDVVIVMERDVIVVLGPVDIVVVVVIDVASV